MQWSFVAGLAGSDGPGLTDGEEGDMNETSCVNYAEGPS
jgi:hypothetical protein